MKYHSTKTFGHEVGLSCCFRQPLAQSHCNLLHGYALSFKFVFGADTLDERNWVVDFGSLRGLKEHLHDLFDHTVAVSTQDPKIDNILALQALGLGRVQIFSTVGCESFAHVAFSLAVGELERMGLADRVKVISCECAEHGANSAIFYGE